MRREIERVFPDLGAVAIKRWGDSRNSPDQMDHYTTVTDVRTVNSTCEDAFQANYLNSNNGLEIPMPNDVEQVLGK